MSDEVNATMPEADPIGHHDGGGEGDPTHHANGSMINATHSDAALTDGPVYECTWWKDDFFDTAANKKAISA